MELPQRFLAVYGVWLCIANRPLALKTILYVQKMVLTPPTQNATKFMQLRLKKCHSITIEIKFL